MVRMPSDKTVEIELAADGQHARDLAAGGVFAPGCALELNEEIWTTAHGYAALYLTGFWPDPDYVVLAARRTARRLGRQAQSVR